MTNYNDGKWHGWNGGECPVHPKTVVDVSWRDAGMIRTVFQAGALGPGHWEWQDGYRRFVAFRVVKEYREPREFWIDKDFAVYGNKGGAEKYGAKPIIHVREVIQ